jgi:general secretion pathway protein A
MFLDHFKMTAHPFSEQPPVDFLLKDERVAQGLARLDYFAHQGPIALLIGQTGVGKSSLLRIFVNSMSRNKYNPVYIHLTHLNAKALLRMIADKLGEVPKIGKDRLFLQIIERARKTESATILIIDEAHLLDLEALTDMRLLVSSDIETKTPLKIILSGQETLAKMLARASLADLVSRICVRCHLKALTREQTAAYIDSRMRSAGASEKVFEPEAKSLIHDYAGGLPRLINNIATACLINAATKSLQKIDEHLVNETMSEFHLP